MSDNTTRAEASQDYILFKTGGQTFGAPLLDIREIVELSELRKMPNAADYFSGLLNLRGEIVGVLDLAKLFGSNATDSRLQAILILDGAAAGLSVKVEQVLSVQSIAGDKVDKGAKVITPVKNAYLIGVTEFDGAIVPIINLAEVVSTSDIKQVRSAMKAFAA